MAEELKIFEQFLRCICSKYFCLFRLGGAVHSGSAALGGVADGWRGRGRVVVQAAVAWGRVPGWRGDGGLRGAHGLPSGAICQGHGGWR